jgi:uncharacterized protein (TIGR01777 family)
MRIIISGGSGMLGSMLSRELANEGHEVIILSRSPEKNRDRFGKGIQVVGWDGKTAAGWGGLVEEADAIVNLTGENLAGDNLFPSRWTESRKRAILESRLQPGQALVEAVEQAKTKPKLLIQSSAVGFYGPRGDEKITEEAGPQDDFLSQVCVQWEASTEPVEDAGVRRVVTRLGIILDEKQGSLPRMILPFLFFVGGPIGSGKQWISYISILDAVKAIRFLLANESAAGVYNVCTPNPATNREFEGAIGKVTSRPSWFPVPTFLMKLLFGEMSTVLLDGQRVLPERLLQAGFKFDYPDAVSSLRAVLKR